MTNQNRIIKSSLATTGFNALSRGLLISGLLCPLWSPLAMFLYDFEHLETTAVDLALMLYNIVGAGLLLAGAITGLSWTIYFLENKLGYKYRLLMIPAFTLLAGALVYCWEIPFPFLFLFLVLLVFVINFPVAELLPERMGFFPLLPIFAICYGIPLFGFIYLFFFTVRSSGVNFAGYFVQTWADIVFEVLWIAIVLIIWWFSLLFLLKNQGEKKPWKKGSVALAARIGACAVSFPILALAFLSFVKIPLSPSVSLLYEGDNFYGMEIDPLTDRLLVTQTNMRESAPKPYSLAFTFDLLDPIEPPGIFFVPTAELESMVLDHENRRIFHANRWTFNEDRTFHDALIMVLDADTFEVKKNRRIDEVCSGSTNHALVSSANRVFVHCEMNNLIQINMDTLETENSINTGEGLNIIGDDTKAVLYMNYDGKPLIEARDGKTLELLYSGIGPYSADKMFYGSKEGRLYLPDGYLGQILAYSTPDLKLIKKIPTQFGQRAFAVDEKNSLLIAGSYLTGYVYVIDLESGKRQKRLYVGKYGRTIVVDPPRRQAFMTTTNQGLFLIRY